MDKQTSEHQCNDEDFPGVHIIKPLIPHETELFDVSTQVGSKLEVMSRMTQSAILSKSVKSQTSNAANTWKSLPKRINPVDVNFGTLVDFMSRVLPIIEDELQQSSTINIALERLTEHGRMEESQESETLIIELVHTLTSATALGVDPKLDATSVTWNCNGTVLAGAYGRIHDLGWGCTKGAVLVWNLGLRTLKPEVPDLKLDTLSGVTSLCFHPSRPPILAAGCFNGGVRLYNISLSYREIGCSNIGDLLHQDPITQIRWVKDPWSRTFMLWTLSLGGKLLCWDIANKLRYPRGGTRIVSNSAYSGYGEMAGANWLTLPGVSVTFSKEVTPWVVSTAGGGLIKCVERPQIQAKGTQKRGDFAWTSEAILLLDAAHPTFTMEVRRAGEKAARIKNKKVVEASHLFQSPILASQLYPPISSDFAFNRHSGPVYGLEISPFEPNILLSGGIDGGIRIYSMLSKAPLLTLACDEKQTSVLGVVWSPTRSSVFAVIDGLGRLHLFDVLRSVTGAVCSFNTREDHLKSSTSESLTDVRWNPKISELIVISGEKGILQVFKVPSALQEKVDSSAFWAKYNKMRGEN